MGSFGKSNPNHKDGIKRGAFEEDENPIFQSKNKLLLLRVDPCDQVEVLLLIVEARHGKISRN